MADPMIITETANDGSIIEIQVIETGEDSTLMEEVMEALSGDSDEVYQAEENHHGDYSTVWVDDDNNIITSDSTSETHDHPYGAMTVDEAYDQINNNHESHGVGMTVDEAYASLETGNALVTVEEAYADLAHSTAQTMNAAQNIPGFSEQLQNDPAVAQLFNLPEDYHSSVMTVDQAYDQINNNHGGGIGMNVDQAYNSLGHNYHPQEYGASMDHSVWEHHNNDSHGHDATDYIHNHHHDDFSID
jgi:hypothetical protein